MKISVCNVLFITTIIDIIITAMQNADFSHHPARNVNIAVSLYRAINPLKPELNPICYLLALLAHHFPHVSRIRVKSLTFRRLMSYIYVEHPFLMFLDHTQRRTTVCRTPSGPVINSSQSPLPAIVTTTQSKY